MTLRSDSPQVFVFVGKEHWRKANEATDSVRAFWKRNEPGDSMNLVDSSDLHCEVLMTRNPITAALLCQSLSAQGVPYIISAVEEDHAVMRDRLAELEQ